MRVKHFLLALLCCTVLASCRTEDPLPAPPPGTLLFGEETNEIAGDILEMADGSFLIVGGKEEKKSGEYDIMLVKVDANGGELWTRIIEDDTRNSYGRFIRETSEGYAIIVLESNGNNYNVSSMSLERYTDDFQLIRRTQISSPGGYYYGSNDPISTFLVTASGDYLIETRTYDRIQIQKITADGVPEEPVELLNTDAGASFTSSLSPNFDGGYVVAHFPQYNSNDLMVTNFDENGDLIGGAREYNLQTTGQVTSVGYLPDSTLLVAAYDYYNGGSGRLVQLDQVSGLVLREFELSNSGSYAQILSEADGSFHLFGNSQNYGNYGLQNSGTVILSFDSITDNARATSYGGSDGDGMKSVIRTSDGRYAIVGYTRSYGAGGTDASLIFYQP